MILARKLLRYTDAWAIVLDSSLRHALAPSIIRLPTSELRLSADDRRYIPPAWDEIPRDTLRWVKMRQNGPRLPNPRLK